MNTNEQTPARLLTPGAAQILIAVVNRAVRTPSYVADVFVNWAPHCNSFDVSVHAGGWESHDHPLHKEPVRYNFSLDRNIEYAEAEYSRLTAHLNSIEAAADHSPDREKLIAATRAAELRAKAEQLLREADALIPTPAESQ